MLRPLPLLVGVLVVLAACVDSEPTGIGPRNSESPAPNLGKGGAGGQTTSLTITPSSTILPVGGTVQLSATKPGRKGTAETVSVTWASSNPTVATVSATGLVTGVSAGGPVTITARTQDKKPLSGTATVAVELVWQQLTPTTTGPSAGPFTTAYAAAHDAVYLMKTADFGSNELWKLDLATNAWTALPSSGLPAGKFRKLIHDPVHHVLLTYWDGLGQVYSVAEGGGPWTALGGGPNSDAYYEGGAFFNPVTQRLAQFAGYGFGLWKNILWEFDATALAWQQQAQSSTKPWPRIGPKVALDAAGERLFVYGEEGSPTGEQFNAAQLLGDVWVLDLKTNGWTSVVPVASATLLRQGSALEYVATTDALYLFGGAENKDANDVHADLHRLDLSSAAPSWEAIAVSGSGPSGRLSSRLHHDALRNRLVSLGGFSAGTWDFEVWTIPVP